MKLRYYGILQLIVLTIKVLFRPSLWIRSKDIDKVYERDLVHALLSGAEITKEGPFTVHVDGVQRLIWIANTLFDYGSQHTRSSWKYSLPGTCSRKTVIMLEKRLSELGLFPEYE